MPSLRVPRLSELLDRLLSEMPWTGSGQREVYRHMIRVAATFRIYKKSFEDYEQWCLNNFTPETCGLPGGE